jgi:hypothetical protein
MGVLDSGEKLLTSHKLGEVGAGLAVEGLERLALDVSIRFTAMHVLAAVLATHDTGNRVRAVHGNE